VLGLTFPRAALASAPRERFSLNWSAPEDCPSAEQVRADVDGLLANRTTISDETLVATVSVQGMRDAGYLLTLKANGQIRTLDGKDCRELAQAAALLLALLVDPSRATSLGESPDVSPGEEQPSVDNNALPTNVPLVTAPNTTQTSPPATSRKSEVGATPEPEKNNRLAEAGLGFDWGSWPVMEPALLLGLGVSTGALQGLAHGSIGLPLHLVTTDGTRVKVFVAAIGLRGAYRFSFGRLALEPAAGFEVGVSRASSPDFVPESRSAVSLSPIGTARSSWRLSRKVRLWGEITAGFPVVRPRWVLEDGESIHRFGPWVRFQSGVQLAF
jgi:hypothetical protein